VRESYQLLQEKKDRCELTSKINQYRMMVLKFYSVKEPEQNRLVSGQFVKRERWVGEKQKLS